MIITDFNKIGWYSDQNKTKALASWLNSQIFNELGGDAMSVSVDDYIQAGKDIIGDIAGLVHTGDFNYVHTKYGDGGWQLIYDNMDIFINQNGAAANALVKTVANMMNEKSENQTNRTHVIQKGYVDPSVKLDANGNLVVTASGREIDNPVENDSGLGLKTIVVIAILLLGVILIFKKSKK